MKLSRNLSIALLSMSLFACGGGGGGDSKATPTPVFSMSVATPVTTLAENASDQLTFSYQNASGAVNLSVGAYASSSPASSYTVTSDDANKAVTVTLGELEQDTTLSFVVTGKDSAGKTASQAVSINITNPSAAEAITQIGTLSSAMPAALAGQQERRILSTLLELGQLTDSITVSSANIRSSSVATSFDASKKAAIEQYISDGKWAERYAAKTITESDIVAASAHLNAALVDYLTEVNTLINTTQSELTTAQIPTFSLGKVFLSDTGVLSQFWGNPAMGSITDGEWKFTDDYEYLTALVLPQSQTCAIAE